MATWKKIAVSGSNISQFNNDSGYITQLSASLHAFSTASFNGTELLAGTSNGNLNFASSSGAGLNITANSGTDTLTWTLADIPNSSLLNDNLRIGKTSIALGATGSTVDGVILTDVIATGSFSGSFTGNLNVNLEDLTPGDGLSGSAYDGNIARTFSVNTSSVHFISGSRESISTVNTVGANGINMHYTSSTGVLSSTIANPSLMIGTSGIDLGTTGSAIAGLTSLGVTNITNTGTISSTHLTGSFTGSFIGDGSGLSGLATTLGVSGSSGNTPINLLTQKLSVLGTANQINTAATPQTLTVSLTDDVTIANDLTVTRDTTIGRNALVQGNLLVLGTASFANTQNLDVADRFIRLASGSTSAGDGGIVVQQAGPTQGEAFAYDAITTRWSMTGSFNPATEAYAPDAFVSTVVVGSGGTQQSNVIAKYSKAGNIFTSASGDIWIYS
jgi:hypothetical protein